MIVTAIYEDLNQEEALLDMNNTIVYILILLHVRVVSHIIPRCEKYNQSTVYDELR